MGIFVNPSLFLRRPQPAPTPAEPLPTPFAPASPIFSPPTPMRGYTQNWPGNSRIVPYDVEQAGLDVAELQPPDALSPAQAGTGPGMAFSSVPETAPQLRVAAPYPAPPPSAASAQAAASDEPPLLGGSFPGMGGAGALLPGGNLLRKIGGGIANAGRAVASGLREQTRGWLLPSPGDIVPSSLLPTANASDTPARPAGDISANKRVAHEVTVASNPTVPFQQEPPLGPTDQEAPLLGGPDPRNAGKKPGDRGYVYTNADLDRVRREGPSRGGFGTFITPEQDRLDKERKLEDMATDVAVARSKAIVADPTGELAYKRRLETQLEFGQRTDRDVLAKKEAITAHADNLIRQARMRADLPPDKREEAVQRIESWRDDQVAILDPRYKRTPFGG